MRGYGLTRFVAIGLLAAIAFPFSDALADKTLEDKTEDARTKFIERDPTMQEMFEDSYAYVLFPRVKKGGAGIGGAHGKGLVYRDGRKVARSSLSQATIGFQLGGKVFSEVIFFEDAEAFEDFQEGDFELSAQASAVAAKEGVAANARYRHGVAIFTMSQGGLMYEASVGGQKFTYNAL